MQNQDGKNWLALVFAVVHVLVLPSPALGQTSAGASECPCVTPTWGGYSDLAAAILTAGLPASYGLEDCKPYDALYNTSGCGGSGVQPSFCGETWCYIDPEACAVNSTKCWIAGFLVNDPAFPACRSRPSALSPVLPPAANAHYSYQTCGSLDNYQQSRHQTTMAGRTIIATTTHDSPYSLVTKDSGGVSFGGFEVDYWRDVMKVFSPALDLQITDSWATPTSSAKFASSFTAVVNDVAVGKYDVAIADFWVTSERMLLTNFLPAIRVDNFYLVVFEKNGETTFIEMLANPFKPFTPAAWGLIVAGIVTAAGAMLIIDYEDEEQYPYESSSFVWRIGKAFYIGMFSLMAGESNFTTSSLPSKVLSLGFQLFLVIVMASYTANLASLLVVANVATGVNSIQGAIDAGYTVCIPVAANQSITQVYPSLKTYVFGGSTTDYARHMWAKKCDAAIIHLKRIDEAHRLTIQEADCKAVADGKFTEEESPCVGRDDCLLARVGDPVVVMPVAFPIRPDDPAMLTAMSWAVTDASNAGKWDAAVKNNAQLVPPSRCIKTAVNSASIDWDGFGGTSFFMAITIVVALGMHFGMAAARMRAAKSSGTSEELELEELDQEAVKLNGAPIHETDAGKDGSGDGDLKAILRRLDEIQTPNILRRLDELQASIEGKTAKPGHPGNADLVFNKGTASHANGGTDSNSDGSGPSWLPFLSGLTGKQ
eukprot:3775761-Rhodomonas_salina.1